jgi:hypothetical protein
MRCHSSTPRTKDGGYVGAWYFPLTEGEPAVTIEDVKCAEVFPPLLSAGSKDVDFDRLRLVSSQLRSFDLWWGDGKACRIVIGASSPDLPGFEGQWLHAYPSAKVSEVGGTAPPLLDQMIDAIASGEVHAGFDVEQAHALPFVKCDLNQRGQLVPHLIRALAQAKYAWV